jgi:hypothetical protein
MTEWSILVLFLALIPSGSAESGWVSLNIRIRLLD